MLRHSHYLQIRRCHTQEDRQSPIFPGPCYLHWDATSTTYAYFLYHLQSKLSCNNDADVCIPVDVVAGSGDEKALRSALDLVLTVVQGIRGTGVLYAVERLFFPLQKDSNCIP